MSIKAQILQLQKQVDELSNSSAILAKETSELSNNITNIVSNLNDASSSTIIHGVDPLIFAVTIFVLACFVGYYVVWRVTPALHTPLMSVTNAISGIIVIGAMLALGQELMNGAKIYGFFAVLLASINIFGGFVVTQRMLAMFRKK